MQLLAKLKKNLYMGFRATLNFLKPVIWQFFDTMIVASIDKE